jgi:hypothetical protein
MAEYRLKKAQEITCVSRLSAGPLYTHRVYYYVGPDSVVSAAKASLRDTGVLTILDSVCDQSDVSHKNWRRSWMRDSWRSCWSRARGSLLSLETTPVRQMEWFDR